MTIAIFKRPDGIKRIAAAVLAAATIETFRLSHDRFLCIDDDVYHIGASIKDLGKKWFGPILSAQTTDKKVNEVTEDLFKEYPDVDAFLTLSIDELENKIKQIGLYRSKAKNILIMCNQLKSKFNGEVPRTMDEITSLADRKSTRLNSSHT